MTFSRSISNKDITSSILFKVTGLHTLNKNLLRNIQSTGCRMCLNLVTTTSQVGLLISDCSKILPEIHSSPIFPCRTVPLFLTENYKPMGSRGDLFHGSLYFHCRCFRFISFPTSAHCLPSYNLDNDFLQSICTIMQYWVQIGTITFGTSPVKPVAYQLRQRGNATSWCSWPECRSPWM